LSPFASQIKARGRQQGKALSQSLEWWWRNRWGLSATDPRYLEATIEEMAVDYWATRYAAEPSLDDHEFDNPDFDADVDAMLQADEDWEEVP